MRRKLPAGRSSGNLFSKLPKSIAKEVFEDLLEAGGLRLERIVSCGHKTSPDRWYDQRTNEWVLLLAGAAKLRFEDEARARNLRPGDWVHIPARKRHRVEWTKPRCKTIWLALHY